MQEPPVTRAPGGLRHEPPLDGRRAVVTGGASGGFAVAAGWPTPGLTTALDRDGDGAHRVAEQVGGEALVADLADPDTLDDLDAQGLRADILVNNAGFQHVAPSTSSPEESGRADARAMLTAPFLLPSTPGPR